MLMKLEDLQQWYSHFRRLPGERFVGIMPLTYGRARIVRGNLWSVDDGW